MKEGGGTEEERAYLSELGDLVEKAEEDQDLLQVEGLEASEGLSFFAVVFDLVDQLFNSSEKRLARVLLMLAHFGKDGVPETVVSKISQETLAEMVGTTRSRVSFFMNRFRKLGFIHYAGGVEGGLQVHSSLLNVVLHD